MATQHGRDAFVCRAEHRAVVTHILLRLVNLRRVHIAVVRITHAIVATRVLRRLLRRLVRRALARSCVVDCGEALYFHMICRRCLLLYYLGSSLAEVRTCPTDIRLL